MKIRDICESDKPREKTLIKGIESLSDAELISLLIRTGTSYESAIDLSYEVLNRIGGLQELKNTTYSEIASIKGMGVSKTLALIACVEVAKRMEIEYKPLSKIKSIEQIVNIFEPLLKNEKQEYLYGLYLDSRQNLIKYVMLYKGGLNEHYIHPRDIFREAIKLNAAAVILLHNHPSGECEPSSKDVETTLRIQELGKEIGIPLIDHLIIGTKRHCSLKQLGLI